MSNAAVQFRSRVPRIAEAAVERARLTVVPRRRVRAKRVPFVSLVSLLLLGGVIGLLLFNTSMQQASFAATSLEDQASSLSAREQTLRMELDVLRDPQHVAEEARKMGMVTGGSPAFLDLSDGKILGKAAPPDPLANVRILPPAPKKPAELTPQPRYVDPPAAGTDSADGAEGADGAPDGARASGASSQRHGHLNGTNGATSHQNQTPHQHQH